jgi:hypothetical protein
MPALLYDSVEAQIVMREILDANMEKQFEQECVFGSMFPFDDQAFVHDLGAQWVDDMEPNPHFRGMSATQRTFGEGSRPGRARFKVTFSELAHTTKFAGRTQHTDAESLQKGWAPLMEDATSTFIKQLNWEIQGDGSGKLATVAAVPAGTAAISLLAPVGASRLLRRGRYNIVDAANPATKRTLTINAVAVDAPYLISKTGGYIANFADTESDTVADAITATTVVVGDIVVIRDHGGQATKGLRYHINNAATDYQNQSRATWPQLIPPIVSAGNGPLSTRVMDHLEYSLIIRHGKQQALDGLFWLTSAAQHAAYRKLGYNTDTKVVKRFGANDRKLDLGYTVIEHNGRTFLLEPDCDEDWLPLLDRSTWKRFGAKAPSVVNDGGRILNAVYDSSGNLNWELTFNINSLTEFANRRIARNGAVTDLQWEGLPLAADVRNF